MNFDINHSSAGPQSTELERLRGLIEKDVESLYNDIDRQIAREVNRRSLRSQLVGWLGCKMNLLGGRKTAARAKTSYLL